MITTSGLTLAIVAHNTPVGQLTSDIALFAGYYTAPWFGVVLVELLARRGQPRPWQILGRSPRRAVTAFVLGFLVLLPFSETPAGNYLAESTVVFEWIGWAARNLLDGGDLGYPVGVVAGAAIYAWLRRRDEVDAAA